MGGETWPPGLTRLLVLALFLFVSPLSVRTQESNARVPNSTGDGPEALNRVQRDVNGVTTVLLVPARLGKSSPPVGLLTKTARTFVQDGASTEYATQVLGTTLDNGRLYARILSTSSRVFYEKDTKPEPTSPFVVYPSKSPQDEWQLRVNLENTPVRIAKNLLASSNDQDYGSHKSNGTNNPSERENDIFNKRELNVVDDQRFKPAKVRAADNLPTYTVKQEYALSGGAFDHVEDEAPRNFRPRVPKNFKPQTAHSTVQKKPEVKPMATVTYHGFADFTTIVGDTVIVFSPSTSPASVGRAATTIKGDATLRPDDGIGIVVQPTSVVRSREKTDAPIRGQPRDPLLDAINGGRSDVTNDDHDSLQPSRPAPMEVDSSSKVTPLLAQIPETKSLKPTGLLKVVDSTTATDGTTTHYKSLIYGTYLGTNYAQIIDTSSNVYFFPDEASATYEPRDTTVDYSSTDTDSEEPDVATTLEMLKSTTPKPTTKAHKTTLETNEVTTPYRDTTENILTTLKDILANAKKRLSTTTEAPDNVESYTDSEITNDITIGDPQGRSIKGSSPQNKLSVNDKNKENGNQVSFATRLLPSTEYKTVTYFTTFFVPDGDRTTTSIKSREVVSSEVTYLTELVLPSATVGSYQSTILNRPGFEQKESMTSRVITTTEEPDEEQRTKEDEEIELIFKTLYTTYTYLTTFFHESTSSISSREVVETNVVTQTVGPNGVSGDVSGLFNRDESIVISSTSVSDRILPTIAFQPGRFPEEQESTTTEDIGTTLEETTEGTLTTLQDQETTIDDFMDSTTSDDEEEFFTNLEPSPTPSMATEILKEQVKTYFTTYTYFTTIFVDDETEIETRTEVFTNVVTEGIQPTAVVPVSSSSATTPKADPVDKPAPPPEILAYLEAIQRQKSKEEALLLAKKVQEMNHHEGLSKQETTIKDFTTESIPNIGLKVASDKQVTDTSFVDFAFNGQVTPNPPVDGEVLGSMITDVVSSSSSGGGTVIGVMDKRNAVPEDQELSESNHHDVESAPTLLLQTSYTTFTYFTTMYKGDATNVVSRLDTVTNVVTETIRPTTVLLAETSTLPVTYFTTFTYWTTFYKGGDTVTTSREETVSNVVTPGVSPTPTLELGVVMTYRPDVAPTVVDKDTQIPNESKVVADNEVTLSDLIHEKTTTEKSDIISPKKIVTLPESDKKIDASTISPEPTTFYTTFTYFTTSYIGNETILNSRLETITSVALPETTVRQATGRAIGGVVPTAQVINTDEKVRPTVNDSPKPSVIREEGPKTGLISTIRSSKVGDGTTTHFASDVYGTYIDGLYAQVIESSSRLETPTPSLSSTPVLPTGVLSLNKGSIVDADEVTTIYFTTKQIGTLIDGLYAKVIESTSSTKIDTEKKATVAPVQGHRTGLVRLIQGNIEANDVTTFYQSKVIGTSIEGRYAQIIESTSSFVVATPTAGISPTSTILTGATARIPDISPSPAVIQSSLSEDSTADSVDNEEDDSSEPSEEGEDSEDDSEDEDGQKSTKKSRLTFTSRKKSFTPVIRPFLSRSRPTFNPKRKGAQAATTITRTDITPTITATLAGKGNRFASTRGRGSSPSGPYSSTLASSGSRRFSGRGRASASISPSSTASFPAGSSRGRGGASRIASSSSFSANRRGPSSIRGSSSRPGPRGSSSIYPSASSRFRPGIRPSSTLNKIQPTIRHEDQDDEANEFSTTTLTTEETPHTEYDDGGETVTVPLQTTTESSRRSTNPILRFRRPPNLSGSQRTTIPPRVQVTTPAARRNVNQGRQNTASSSLNRGSSRVANRPTPPLATRSRQSGQLYPPRGLRNNKKPEPVDEPAGNDEEFEGEDEENFEDDPVEEIADNDYEGSEDATTTTKYGGNRRQSRLIGSPVSIRPFGSYGRSRRVRRQASQLRSLTNRFRRPLPSSVKAEDRSDTDVSASREEVNRSVAPTKQSSRYSARGRSLSSTRLNANPHKTSAERFSADSSEILVKPRVRTNPRVKPSPTTGSNRQFTLREKDSSSRPGYKRTTPTTSRNRPTGKQESGLRVRPRIRNSSSRSTESPTNHRRAQSTRSSSRSSGNRNNNRRVPNRGRGSHEDSREAPYIHKDNEGTITVTHYVPTEVTIPIVNNGITEQKNVITAHPSTEVLGPDQYSTVIGGNGRPLVVIVTEATGSNSQGQLEITRFLLHETPTTRVSHTLTTLGGRRASQSIIVPSTVYSVEKVISTVQPSLPAGNGPLANILLSQLLLGQLNQQNPLIGGQGQGTPTTQYNTRTTSYVTTITKHQSTVIPLTFRGKEILTTLVDSSTDVVTATEFITDTVVVTPTATVPAAGLNSLLLLLQQPQQQQQAQHSLLDPLFAAAPLLTQSNTLPGEVERRYQPADFDYRPNNYDDSEEEISAEKPARSRARTGNTPHRHNDNRRDDRASQLSPESSVITLYVSGRRPGEFSTVLSTVKISDEATVSRRRRDLRTVQASAAPSLHAASEGTSSHLAGSEESVNAHAPTQSLESVVDESLGEYFAAFGQKKTRDERRKRIDGGDYYDNHNENPEVIQQPNIKTTPRRVVRVRVPVARSRMERQHKYTIVRRRPLVTQSIPIAPIVVSTPTARRIVVTRVRSLGRASQSTMINDDDYLEAENNQPLSTNRHRVTVTRRRKIQPTSISKTVEKPRVTRKKLVNVRPIVQPTTPTFAIITTGFYSAPSTSDEDDDTEFAVNEESPNGEIEEEPEKVDNSEETPNLKGRPDHINNKPEEDFADEGEDVPSKFELKVPEQTSKVEAGPVIITDNFFFPEWNGEEDNGETEEEEQYGDAEEEEEEEYEEAYGDYNETTTDINEYVTTGNPQLSLSDQVTTLEVPSPDLPESTTVGSVTEAQDNLTETDEKTTANIEEQTEENTESALTVTTAVDGDTDQTESTTSTDWKMEDPTTERSIDDSDEEEFTSYPETTTKLVVIYNENTDDSMNPVTTVKPLTINVEEQRIHAKVDDSSPPNVTIIPEEVTIIPEEKYTITTIPNESSTVESIILDSISESPDMEADISIITNPIETNEDDLSVLPLESYEKALKSSSEIAINTINIRPTSIWSSDLERTEQTQGKHDFTSVEPDVPTVIPLEADPTISLGKNGFSTVTTSYASPTTEDIEAGLADELYLSLSRPDFSQIIPSKSIDNNDDEVSNYDNVIPTPELSTSVYYTETIVTSTKLRTYTYVVTKLNGLETEVTSSTTVRPRVTTLTLTVPVTVTISPKLESSAHNNVVVASVYSPVSVAEYDVKEEEEGRRFNLATRIMSNGVEVIVAGPTPALRWENSNPQPTLTLSDTVVMLMPQEEPNEFVTKTCTTTFTYLNTITKNGATIVSTDQQVVANTATEERHRKPGSESASVTLQASPTLRTEVFKTTYTYLTLNTDHPDINDALGSSMKVITNTVTAPQHYLDMLEPSEVAQPETNTYMSTRKLEKTFLEDGRTRIETISDTVKQLIITASALPPPRPTSVATTLTALDSTDESMTDITKTYFITYTYLNTYLEKGSTVIHTNIATSTDVVLEKVPVKKTTVQSVAATPTPEPIQIFATKTYLTTFTYFTTLLQAGTDGETLTTISSRSHIVENVVTESIAPSLLDAGYMNALLTTAHHSDSVKNVVTGSTIIFFDEEDQIDPTTTSQSVSPSTTLPELEASDKVTESTPESPQTNPAAEVAGAETQLAGDQPVVTSDSDSNSTSSSEDIENKRPSTTPGNTSDMQVSNLLNLGSLGINSLSALGPVITAMAGMAGLLQGKSTATRRNDTVPPIEAQEVTTQRSPIYIPVAEFADGDIETAESQNIAAQLINPGLNYIPETRHKVAASLADGIPISPGEVITANSDVIIGRPGKLGPRPPHTKLEEHIGMKPPPMSVPNIPVHPVLAIVQDSESDLQAQPSIQSHRNTQIQILSAHQVYEKHLKVLGPSVNSPNSQGSAVQLKPQQIQSGPPLRHVGNKQNHVENDPLLIPPSRPNVEQYANPNINPKDAEWNRERFRRPWSAQDPLASSVPSKYDGIQADISQETKPWPNRAPNEKQKRPPWAQKDPLLTGTSIVLESSETKLGPSEPIIHQVPHVIDRSTGQPLLVNIQPSQVANVVIPQGGTQALIFGDTSEPHISGQYFDDPSPYPEPEVSPGFVGVEKVENNPAIFMVPPAPPINFKPLPQQSSNGDHPQTIPLSHSQSHFNLGKPQDNSAIVTSTRPDKRPSEVLLIQHPGSHDQSSGQGHVHTEILVHHRPESVNARPQVLSQTSINSHGNYPENHEPPRRDYTNKNSRPVEQPPPRRSEIISMPTESPHQYIYMDNNKPGHDTGNELKLHWKFNRKPQRNPPVGRPDRRPERPSIRPHVQTSHSYPIFERPGAYPSRKPQYSPTPSRPNPYVSTHNLSNQKWHSQTSHESQKTPVTQSRPVQSYPKEPFSRPQHVEHDIVAPSSNMPTGAIGYYNPSNDPKIQPIDTQYYPQLPTVKPEIHSFGEILPSSETEHEVSWHIDTQTERSSEDSVSDASENVKVHNDSQDHSQTSHEQDDEIGEEQTFSSSKVHTQNEEMKVDITSSTNHSVGSINAVVGKPLDTQQSINYENQNKDPPNFGHLPILDYGQESYNAGSYQNPVVQGKPYGEYDDQPNSNKPNGQRQPTDGRPDYEVIQGVPFSQHGNQRPDQSQRPTSRPYDHDDTMDLKPPAATGQFGGAFERPGRPFPRPQGNSSPESRPFSRPRPEHDSTNKNRPVIDTHQSNRPISVTNESHARPPQNNQKNTYTSHYDWAQGSKTSGNSENQGPVRNDYQGHSVNVEVSNNRHERRNQTNDGAKQVDSYFPQNTEGSTPNDKVDRSTIVTQTSGTRVHPAYPHILTKPRPSVPGPITITSNNKRPSNAGNGRPKIQFSLPVEASGEEKDSITQTERPPSMLITANGQKNKKQNQETLVTASQTNFATPDRENVDSKGHEVKANGKTTESKNQDSIGHANEKPRVPSQNMMPPPLRKNDNNAGNSAKDKNEDGLKPPPRSSDVVGLSPPPVVITTTGRPKEDRFSFSNSDETGLRLPPKYIPLKETVGTLKPLPPPSTSMVPPSPRPTMARPLIVDLLSQDMVPPPLVVETTRTPVVIATVRPAIAVSGSIQIATAVAASHIPVMQDAESRIPIVHGTVDLPIVMDASDIMKPLEADKSEHVSIYTVRPFETRPISKVSVQPTTIITSNLIMPTKLRSSQIGHVQTVGSSINRGAVPTRLHAYDNWRKSTERLEHPVFLESSRQNVDPSMDIEATESLSRETSKGEGSIFHRTQMQKYPNDGNDDLVMPTVVTRVHSSVTRMTNTFISRREKLPKTKDFSGSPIHKVAKNGTTATVEMKPKAVTHYKTLTVTRTETSVLGSPPTTRTLLLTHTLTSTIVETVTETLLRPTSVVATVTSTVLQPVTQLPNSYENPMDNDSIFVVMSDQSPPSPGAEEVEAEYGEEEVSRDEQDPIGNEIHRVLAGGILGAPVSPMRPMFNQCQPECKASKAEICSEGGTEPRCVCRPGFARMFPDRPCKPTYTYTVRVGLERMGREPVFYEAALNDTSSPAFRRLALPTREALHRTMMQSDLRDVYRSLDIAGFMPNPTKVEFHVQLTDNTNETRLKEVLRKYLIGSNYSLGGTEVFAARDLEMIEARDFDECLTHDGGPHHDCSPHAGCFNVRGSYQCSCKEGWADLSENPAYPGRVCSQAPLGCAGCSNKGHCITNVHGHEICECFPWHSGQRCQVNLKVLLIALVTTGAILLGLLAVCLGLACFRSPGRRGKSGDRRAMIPGTAGDTSSEGSVTDLAIPHHVPHVLPPPPRSVAPAPPAKRPARKITPNARRGRSPRKASVTSPVPANEEQCDRSLTVMIPRAKYRSMPHSPQNYKSAMSTFAADEHKLISYLESGAQPGNRKISMSSTKDFVKNYEESGGQMTRNAITTSGALVSAGFQVSATVTRTGDAESTMARSCAETTQVEPSTMKTTRSSDLQGDVGSTLACSCGDTSTSTKLLRLDFGDSSGSTMAKSCGDTTIQTSTKIAPSRRSDSKDARDSGSEGHLTMERDLGSTLRLTSQHPALYKPDRTSDRDSNFDSL